MELRPSPCAPGEPLAFEFTHDPSLLAQYHAIYEREFRVVHEAWDYRHTEDEHDRRGNFLVVRRGEVVVGGARLSIKTLQQPDLLPIEMEDFRIEGHFPYLADAKLSYGQVGRVCLLPSLRDGSVTRVMFWHIHRQAFALGLHDLFDTATLVGARTYKRHCRALGLDVEIYTDIDLPEYPMCDGLRFCLTKTDVAKAPLGMADFGRNRVRLPEEA